MSNHASRSSSAGWTCRAVTRTTALFVGVLAALACGRSDGSTTGVGDANAGATAGTAGSSASAGNGAGGTAGSGAEAPCLHCNQVFAWWSSAYLCPGVSKQLLDDVVACVCKPEVCGGDCAAECADPTLPAGPTCIHCTGSPPKSGYGACISQVMACQADSASPVCGVNTSQCKGDLLQSCKGGAGGGSPGPAPRWVDVKTCPPGTCNPKLGDCTTTECSDASQCPATGPCKLPTCTAGVCGHVDGCLPGKYCVNGTYCVTTCTCPDGSAGWNEGGGGPCQGCDAACKVDTDCPGSACGDQVCGEFPNQTGLVCMTPAAPGSKHSTCVTAADCKCKAQGATCTAGQCSVIAP